MCAYGRPIVVYDNDEEPDPAIVGINFHKEWLRAYANANTVNTGNTLTMRRRDSRRRGASGVVGNSGSGRTNAQSEQLMGLMGGRSDSVSSYSY